MNANSEFMHISEILPGIPKEISRRAELWPHLEAESAWSLTDAEFLAVAQETGGQL